MTGSVVCTAMFCISQHLEAVLPAPQAVLELIKSCRGSSCLLRLRSVVENPFLFPLSFRWGGGRGSGGLVIKRPGIDDSEVWWEWTDIPAPLPPAPTLGSMEGRIVSEDLALRAISSLTANLLQRLFWFAEIPYNRQPCRTMSHGFSLCQSQAAVGTPEFISVFSNAKR